MDARSNGTSRASSHLFRMKRDNNFSLCDLALSEVIKSREIHTRRSKRDCNYVDAIRSRLNFFLLALAVKRPSIVEYFGGWEVVVHLMSHLIIAVDTAK